MRQGLGDLNLITVAIIVVVPTASWATTRCSETSKERSLAAVTPLPPELRIRQIVEGEYELILATARVVMTTTGGTISGSPIEAEE